MYEAAICAMSGSWPRAKRSGSMLYQRMRIGVVHAKPTIMADWRYRPRRWYCFAP